MEISFSYEISLMLGLLSLLRANPEVSLVLFNFHTQDVEQSEVNLVDVESVMLVFAMLASLEDVHIEAVRIVGISASTLEGSVVVSIFTVSEAAKPRH